MNFKSLDQRELNIIFQKVLAQKTQNRKDRSTWKYMFPAKKVLLLKNLSEQKKIKNNTYRIIQVGGDSRFDLENRIIYDPNIKSEYNSNFFSFDNATWKNALVDFADDVFGGGVMLPHGFAQEEKLLMETNLISEYGKYKNLSQSPLYIQCLQTHEFIGAGKTLYGISNKKNPNANTIDKANIHTWNIWNYLIEKQSPKGVNIIAMAAINFNKTRHKKYIFRNYAQMFDVAYKWFRMHRLKWWDTVHTWARGTGIFGNSVNVTCVLQILAAQAAWVKLVYHRGKDAYDSALRFLKWPYQQGKTYQDVFGSLKTYMQDHHRNKQYRRPQN